MANNLEQPPHSSEQVAYDHYGKRYDELWHIYTLEYPAVDARDIHQIILNTLKAEANGTITDVCNRKLITFAKSR